MNSAKSVKATLGQSVRAVKYLPSSVSMVNKLRKHLKLHDKAVILISTPEHRNLGDHAIAFAERVFFEKMNMSEMLFEITAHQYLQTRSYLQKLVRPSDLIVIDGGGNIGSLWPDANNRMNDIIVRFKDNPVVIFPQTAFFEESAFGEHVKRQIKSIYSSHNKLLLYCRDKRTWDTMSQLIPGTQMRLVPDIVLSLNPEMSVERASTALLCLRSDKERILEQGALECFSDCCRQNGLTVLQTSTLSQKNVTPLARKEALLSKWREFASSRIVITDRLHGMLFAAITGTPCVALDNSSRKVSGGYEWISDCDYIKVAMNQEDVPRYVCELLEARPTPYNLANRLMYLEMMQSDIEKLIN